MARYGRKYYLLLYLQCYNIMAMKEVVMALTKQLIPVGNSTGLTFDKPILKQVGWDRGTEVDVRVEGETVILTRHYATDEEARIAGERVMRERRKLLERLARR